jgi:hypothetical protein
MVGLVARSAGLMELSDFGFARSYEFSAPAPGVKILVFRHLGSRGIRYRGLSAAGGSRFSRFSRSSRARIVAMMVSDGRVRTCDG